MRTLFGLSAKGDSLNGWPFRMFCKRLFWTKEDAEAYTQQFEKSCYDTSHFECASEGTLKITVQEFEIDETKGLDAFPQPVNSVSAKDGLLYRDGRVLDTMGADSVAREFGFAYAEELVNVLQKTKPKER